jgi:anti-anti-sigma regulatory factor
VTCCGRTSCRRPPQGLELHVLDPIRAEELVTVVMLVAERDAAPARLGAGRLASCDRSYGRVGAVVRTTNGRPRLMGDRIPPWVLRSLSECSPGDHVCWPFRGRGELAGAVEAFVAEGLAMQERVVYMADGDAEERHGAVAGVEGVDGHLDRGQLQTIAIDTMSASDSPVDPVKELSVLASMVEGALSAGYVGMRLFVDATPRAADGDRRAGQVCYEHQLDRFCLSNSITVVCAYDLATLGDSAAAEVECVHPLTGSELSPFHVRAAHTADIALAGSVDVLCAAELEQALARIGLAPTGGQAVVDASDLAFIDARGLIALERHAADNGATMLLSSPPRVVVRLAELVDLRAVRVQGPR